MKVFLISPVRGIGVDERREIAAYVAALGARGVSVHWPLRDTPQGGDGFAICCENRAAIRESDEIHVWWSEASQGSIFDLGMAFALDKPVRLARPVRATPGKSFANVLRALVRAAPAPVVAPAPAGNDVVCGDHWHGLSGEPVDGSTGCPWCLVASLRGEIASLEEPSPAKPLRVIGPACAACGDSGRIGASDGNRGERCSCAAAPLPVPAPLDDGGAALPRLCPACESPEKWGDQHAPWCPRALDDGETGGRECASCGGRGWYPSPVWDSDVSCIACGGSGRARGPSGTPGGGT